MDFLSQLWAPVLVAAAFVFVVSSVIHMAVPWHKGDFTPLDNEAKALDGLRAAGVKPGNYMFPGCTSMKDMGSPEMIEKYKRGPVGSMIVLPNGPPAIGRSLVQWFIHSIVVGVFAAYVTWLGVGPLGDGSTVLRVAGTAAFMAYGLGAVCDSIWKGVKWSTTFKFVVDGLLYGLATGATFAWLWPSPALPV